MKKNYLKYLLITASVALLPFLNGCNTEKVDPSQAELDLSINNIEFGSVVSSKTFDVTSNRDWTVTIDPADADWIAVDPASGSNNGTVTVSVVANPGTPRSVNLKVATSTLHDYITVTQEGEQEGVLDILKENVGTTPVTANTNVGEFTGWSKLGTGAANVVYSGTGATVRTTSPSTDKYTGASGGNCVFLAASPQFTIGNIDITGKTNLTLEFGISHQADYPNYAPITENTISVSASLDGTNWAKLTFTNASTANWVLATSEFKVPDGSTKLYLKFDNPITASQVRLDDFRLYPGGNGALLDFGTPPDPTDDILLEHTGAADGTNTTLVGVYTGWNKLGTGAANVTYSGNNATVRTSVASSGYTGASGGNNVFFGAAPQEFVIGNINITGKTNFTFEFGISHQVYPDLVTIDGTTISVHASLDGTNWAKLTFTNTSTAGWVLATSEFKVPAGSTTLYIKFDNAIEASVVRLDDFRLFEGGNGVLLDFGTPPDPSTSILKEDVGKVNVASNTDIGAFTGWSRVGTGATNVTYSGTANTSIRTSSASSGYTDASGGNCVFFGTTAPSLTIGNIDITGKTNFTFQFGISHYSNNVWTPITGNSISLHASLDGTNWADLAFTNANTAGWVLATSEFKVPAGSTKLYLKFDNPIAVSVIRMDDLDLFEGGNGTLIEFEPAPVLTTVPISDVMALKSNIPANGNNHTITGNWKISGTVISDNSTAHVQTYQFAVQDGTSAHSGIMVNLTETGATHTYVPGDVVEIVVKNATLSNYHGLAQLKVSAANITKTGSVTPLGATTITTDQLSNYESMYVAIVNTQVKDNQGETVLNDGSNISYVMEVDNSSQTYLMFVRSGATFASQNLPMGSGTLKGLSSVYDDNWQINPTKYADLDLSGARFGGATLTFGTPTLSGTLTVGTAISGAKISIPYTNAAGTETYSYTVAVSGAGADGITASPASGTLTAGSGTISIPLSGTPTTAGAVTFTINGTPVLTTNTVSATVAGGSSGGESIIYQTGFESGEGFAAGTVYNNTDEAASGQAGHIWKTFYGTASTTSPLSGLQSMQMRWYTTATTSLGYTYTDFNLSNVTKVVFNAANTLGLNVTVSYSTDGGTTWIGQELFTLTTSSKDYTYVLDNAGVTSARIRFQITLPATTPTNTARLYIDDVKIYGTN